MHGKQFLLDAVYAGIDETYIYGRLDFVENKVPEDEFRNRGQSGIVGRRKASVPRRALRLDVGVEAGRIRSWKVSVPDGGRDACGV